MKEGIKDFQNRKNVWKIAEVFFLLILLLYPLRHVTWGGDLWDIGYNYGNFQFGDIDRMGKMWFFSTYFANAVGHFLTMLPFGHTMVGLNVYTGFFTSLLAIVGYLFCTKKLGVSPVLAFVGEMIAISMCWCPTALLYNYITYVLFLICAVLLYQGLTNDRKWMLFVAGICLGTNVFVRFSNLPEMGLIAAVWYFDLWKGLEEGREDAEKSLFQIIGGRIFRDTLLCLGGYLAALAVFFLWIGIGYGLDSYVSGIQLLFAMTDTATDYKPASMLYGLFWPFKESLGWLKKLIVFGVAVCLLELCTDYAAWRRPALKKILCGIKILGGFAVTVIMVYWLFLQREGDVPNFTTYYYNSYDPIFWPGTLFLLLTMGIGLIECFRKGSSAEERFLGSAMILVVLLTAIGSNNGIYPSLNNLFIAAPYVLWKIGQFTRWSLLKNKKLPKAMSGFPLCLGTLSVLLWAFLLVCAIQFGMFGALFSFCEGTGQQEKGFQVRGNKVLQGIGMSAERANWLQGLSDFAAENGFEGREVILHGNIPAVSFYLQMRPSFHSWNDLASFGIGTMQETMEELKRKNSLLLDGAGIWPVVIADKKSLEKPESAKSSGESTDKKWELIMDYMKECSGEYSEYRIVYQNEKFVVWDMVAK